MSNPVADAYNALSGVALYAGKYAVDVPNDVVANVWTPTKDGAGDIYPDSWNNLPLNEWCRVAGTPVEQIRQQLITAGLNIDFGAGGVTAGVLGTFNAWVGMALDEAGGKAYNAFGGGHYDSSISGVWRLDLERMGSGAGWVIAKLPPNPDAPGFVWSATYRAGGTGTFTIYSPTSEDPPDVLPDGRPASRHNYCGVWFDSLRSTVNTSRNRRATFDTLTGAVTTQRWFEGATLLRPTIDHSLHYDAATDRVIGNLQRSDGEGNRFSKHDPSTAGLVVDLGMPFSHLGSGSNCKIGNKILQFSGEPVDHWGLFDIPTETWTHADITSGAVVYDFANEMMVCVYVPQLNKVIRRGTASPIAGNWFLFDVATKAQQAYAPLGLVPPLAPFPGTKCFYYDKRRCVVYVSPTAMGVDAVYVMRTG